MPGRQTDAAARAVAWLRTPQAIRQRCEVIYAAAERDKLPHFSLHPERLDAAADYVLAVMRANFPDLAIPYHSRWRHFAAGGRDRWAELRSRLELDGFEIGRIRTELAIVSVLLDAGAGPAWQYCDSDSRCYPRSEGLALASLHMYADGLFSAHPDKPLRADAAALAGMTPARLAAGFQVTDANPLVGLEGRVTLLRRLAGALQAQPDVFGAGARLGGLFDRLMGWANEGALPAPAILIVVLQALSGIWPGRLRLAGVELGDVWHHPAARSADRTSGLVPFHKLSQWLSYSLVEPLEEAGLTVTELDQLTGLPEYRNGGLFLDLGVLQPRDPRVLAEPQPVGSEPVVEWRALTVALLDRLAARIRQRVNMDAARLPLARVLEGGSWAAGRRIAHERRRGGTPPLTVISDGTVF